MKWLKYLIILYALIMEVLIAFNVIPPADTKTLTMGNLVLLILMITSWR
jgi:hypothetical protein